MRLAGVGKRYGRGGWVLRDVELTVAPGQVIAIRGANGSGKSTLLRLLVGVSRPSTGRISERPDVIGYVPERFPPNERFSALAYLTHLGRIRGLSTKTAHARAGELLDRLALVGGADVPVRQLSKGNAQKVALAQALLLPPRLLVADEPWSGLDATAHGVLAEIIGEVAGAGGAVVFTDHRESVTVANATHRYAVAAGHLTSLATVAPQPSRVATVTLAGTANQAELGGRTGVRAVRGTTVEVADEWCDAFLAAVLADGWSVREVRRAPAEAATHVKADPKADAEGERA